MAQTIGAPARWTAADVADQSGRTAVVTGANRGIGFETARVLAERGAAVVLACRDTAHAEQAAQRIRAGGAPITPRVVPLDLASLASVRETAARLRGEVDHIDLLINNAGVMWPPQGKTSDGFELQFGINHLGHFALTGLLLDRLREVPGSRVVTVSSVGHKPGVIDFDDLQFERREFVRGTAYSQSKVANLLFAYELQRRLAASGAQTISLAAHPGAVHTDLARHVNFAIRTVVRVVVLTSGQPNTLSGALPSLRAATDPRATGAEYYGPDGKNEYKGYPVLVQSNEVSHDQAVATRLWDVSESLTGVTYEF